MQASGSCVNAWTVKEQKFWGIVFQARSLPLMVFGQTSKNYSRAGVWLARLVLGDLIASKKNIAAA